MDIEIKIKTKDDKYSIYVCDIENNSEVDCIMDAMFQLADLRSLVDIPEDASWTVTYGDIYTASFAPENEFGLDVIDSVAHVVYSIIKVMHGDKPVLCGTAGYLPPAPSQPIMIPPQPNLYQCNPYGPRPDIYGFGFAGNYPYPPSCDVDITYSIDEDLLEEIKERQIKRIYNRRITTAITNYIQDTIGCERRNEEK